MDASECSGRGSGARLRPESTHWPRSGCIRRHLLRPGRSAAGRPKYSAVEDSVVVSAPGVATAAVGWLG